MSGLQGVGHGLQCKAEGRARKHVPRGNPGHMRMHVVTPVICVVCLHADKLLTVLIPTPTQPTTHSSLARAAPDDSERAASKVGRRQPC